MNRATLQRKLKHLLAKSPPLFQGLEQDQIKTWLSDCEFEFRGRDEIILEADTIDSKLFLLVEGGARVCLSREDSRPLAELIPGDVIGEASSLSGKPTSAWVIASS